ncbi:MAG: SCO family protein [Sphingobacteriales bacterium]|nr:SCO family protein [Sphingobacteriales bacterium]
MIKRKLPILKILILVIILTLPGFLYYLLQEKGKNRYKSLPIFGPKEISGTYHIQRGKKILDTIYHQIPNISFITSKGNAFNLNNIKRQLIIVNFFYADDSVTTPKLNKQIKALYEEYKDNKIIHFLSISINPKKDTPLVLKQYAQKIGAMPGKWDVVTTDSATVFDLAKNQFYVNAAEIQGAKPQLIVSNKLILLDAEHRIRGYYDGTSTSEISRLSDESKVLITEELRKIKTNF